LELNSKKKCCLLGLTLLLAGVAASCAKNAGSDVAATVDGEKIYRADVERYFQNQTSGSNQPLSDEQATGLRLSILENLIENQILMHRAGKLGLLASDEEVDRRQKKYDRLIPTRNLRKGCRSENSRLTTLSARSAVR